MESMGVGLGAGAKKTMFVKTAMYKVSNPFYKRKDSDDFMFFFVFFRETSLPSRKSTSQNSR